jgi:hypothetical protein
VALGGTIKELINANYSSRFVAVCSTIKKLVRAKYTSKF